MNGGSGSSKARLGKTKGGIQHAVVVLTNNATPELVKLNASIRRTSS